MYRAHDERLNREIALKVLPPSLVGDPDARARFQREARAVAALNHPNIVTIHEVGEDGDHPFIAFELVDGETLRDRIARGRLTTAEVLALACPIAEGLQHAHEHGVVHRDLKPENIMVRRDGQVKILDFGLGKMMEQPQVEEDVTTNFPTGATESGTFVGTVGYASPEHLIGRPVDARSDQFAIGAILYEMLTGRRAFARGTRIQTLNSIIEDEPAPIITLAPRTPRRLTAIVNRCLRKKPDDRFATTRELAEALRNARSAPQPWPATMLWVAACLVPLLIVAGALLVPRLIEQRFAATTADPAQRRSVVLPFGTIGGGDQAVADGLTELLTTQLSGFERENRGLFIVSATEVRREGVSNARDARRSFGATLVVSGNVLRTGNTIRLTLNLTDTVSLAQVQGKVIEGESVDVLSLHDDAVTTLAEMLGVQAAATDRGERAASGAYDHYVSGRGHLQRFERLDDVERAIELFGKAVMIDPGFALGHAALGEAVWRKYELTRDPALVVRARLHVKDAIARDSDNAQVHLSSGIVALGTGSYETAVSELKQAQLLDPMNADVYRELGRAYAEVKRYTDAEATYRKAIDMRPGDWSAYGALGQFLARRQRYAEALQQFQHVVRLTPDNARGYSNLGAVYLYLQQYDEAAKSLEQSVSIRATPEALSNLGTLYFNRGRFAEAAERFKRSVDLNGNNYRMWGNLGSAYNSVPDPEQSRAAYERASELAQAELRVDPRAAEILADLADFSQGVGRRTEARDYARRALAAAAPNDGNVLFKVAVAYEGLGDRTQALPVLDRAVRAGVPVDRMENSRSLADLRADPRYARIVNREKE